MTAPTGTDAPTETPPVAAPEPAPTPEPVVPEPVAPEAPKPLLTKREARQGARAVGDEHERRNRAARAAEPEPVEPKAEPTEPTEAVAAKPEPVTEPVTEPVATEPATEPTTEPEPVTEPVATEPPTEPATIEPVAEIQPVRIPEGHPLHAMGVSELHYNTEEERRVGAALIKGTYARRNEVDDIRKRLHEVQDENLRLKATAQATNKWAGTPEYKKAVEVYDQIKDSVGDEAASAHWAGVRAQFAKIEQQEVDTEMVTLNETRKEEAAQRWTNDAWDRAQALPEVVRSLPNFKTLFDESISVFDHELAKGFHPDIKSEEEGHQYWIKNFASRLMNDPTVKALINKKPVAEMAAETAEGRQRRDKKIADDAVADFKRNAADTRREVPPHAMAPLAAQATSRLPEDQKEEPSHSAPQSVHSLKRQLKQEAREAARKRFGLT